MNASKDNETHQKVSSTQPTAANNTSNGGTWKYGGVEEEIKNLKKEQPHKFNLTNDLSKKKLDDGNHANYNAAGNNQNNFIL